MRKSTGQVRGQLRVLKEDDIALYAVGTPEHLLLQALKTVTHIIEIAKLMLHRLDVASSQEYSFKTILTQFVKLDQQLFQEQSEQRKNGPIAILPIPRGAAFSRLVVASNNAYPEQSKNEDVLSEDLKSVYGRHRDIVCYLKQNASSYGYRFSDLSAYTFLALQELEFLIERSYERSILTLKALCDYSKGLFTYLIPSLENSYNAKIDTAALSRVIVEIIARLDKIISENEFKITGSVDTSDLASIIKNHQSGVISVDIEAFVSGLQSAVSSVAAIKVMHPASSDGGVSLISRLLWLASERLFGPLASYAEKIKAQVVGQSVDKKVADKIGFSYVCDKIIEDYKVTHRGKTEFSIINERRRASLDTVTSIPSHVPAAQQKQEHEDFVNKLYARRTARSNSVDPAALSSPVQQGGVPLPPVLGRVKAVSATRSLTRDGKVSEFFAPGQSKKPPKLPPFKGPLSAESGPSAQDENPLETPLDQLFDVELAFSQTNLEEASKTLAKFDPNLLEAEPEVSTRSASPGELGK